MSCGKPRNGDGAKNTPTTGNKDGDGERGSTTHPHPTQVPCLDTRQTQVAKVATLGQGSMDHIVDFILGTQ